MHHVVAVPAAQQVPQHAQPEHQRRGDLAAAVGGVQRQFRPRRHDAHPIDPRLLAVLPLAQRQVGDLVALLREALGEVAIPALSAPDGAGEEAVVYEADAHIAWESATDGAPAADSERYRLVTCREAPPPAVASLLGGARLSAPSRVITA